MKRTYAIAAGLIGALTTMTSAAFADDLTVVVNVGASSQTSTQAPAVAPAPESEEWRTALGTGAHYLFGQAASTAQIASEAGLDSATVMEGFELRNDAQRFHRNITAGASLSVIVQDHAELQNRGRLYLSHLAAHRLNATLANSMEALSEELDSLRLVMNNTSARYGAPTYRPATYTQPAPRPAVIVVQAPPRPAARMLPPPPRPRAETRARMFRPRVIVRPARHRARAHFVGPRHEVSWQF